MNSVLLHMGGKLDFQEIKVFPNPAQNKFTIQFDNSTGEDVKILITDLTGRTVFEKDFADTGTSFNESFNLQNLCSGAYIVKASTKLHTHSLKIFIQKKYNAIL